MNWIRTLGRYTLSGLQQLGRYGLFLCYNPHLDLLVSAQSGARHRADELYRGKINPYRDAYRSLYRHGARAAGFLCPE